MGRRIDRSAMILGFTLALCACGGGDGGVAYIPPPPAPPPPVDPNAGEPPMPADAIGLTGGPFATYTAWVDRNGNLNTGADDFHISYSAADNVYTVSGPGLNQGHLVQTSISEGSWMTGSSKWLTIRNTNSYVTEGDSTTEQAGSVTLDWANAPYSESNLTYTSFGSWGAADNIGGYFVYGTPTLAGDVPVTGTADYTGEVRGTTSLDGALSGSIDLQFDFAAGTLAGSMQPMVADWTDWGALPLGTYTMRDTVYSSGGTTFSGAWTVPGSNADSSFRGNFNGPGAVEAMGNWSAPYQSPNSGQWGTMIGVFGATKKP